MNLEMQRLLLELSVYHNIEPRTVFQRVLEVLTAYYPGAMAMINLVAGERIQIYATANPHPALAALTDVRFADSY